MRERHGVSGLVRNAELIFDTPAIESTPGFPAAGKLGHSMNLLCERRRGRFDVQLPLSNEEIELRCLTRGSSHSRRAATMLRSCCDWRQKNRNYNEKSSYCHRISNRLSPMQSYFVSMRFPREFRQTARMVRRTGQLDAELYVSSPHDKRIHQI